MMASYDRDRVLANDTSEDEFSTEICLSERLQLLKAGGNSIPIHAHRTYGLTSDNSSSSSVELQNKICDIEYQDNSLKKRQNSDLNVELFTNPKRTCLNDLDFKNSKDVSQNSHTNGYFPNTSEANFSSIPQTNYLHPDSTYEDHLGNPHMNPEPSKNIFSAMPRNRERPLPNQQSCSFSFGAQLKESGSDDDFITATKKGALKGGGQLHPLPATKTAFIQKSRRVLQSDSEDEESAHIKYRRYPVIFTSSDSDEEAFSFVSHLPESEPLALPTSSNLAEQNQAGPSTSTSCRPICLRRGRKMLPNARCSPPSQVKSCTKQRQIKEKDRANDEGGVRSNDEGGVRSNSRVTRSSTALSRPLRKSVQRSRGSTSLAATYPDLFDAEDSEVELFSANSYSDTEANAASMNWLTLKQREKDKPKQSSASCDLVGDNAVTVSSEDEISVLFSTTPEAQIVPPQPRRRTKVIPRYGARRCHRGTKRFPTNRRVETISLSPDPVEQVRQLEEDERFARMLQAQFDSEVDPDFAPQPQRPSPPPSDTSTDSIVDIDDSRGMFMRTLLENGPLQGLHCPHFLPDLRPSGRGRARGRRMRVPSLYSALLFNGTFFSTLNNHQPLATRLMLDDSSDENSFEALLNLAEGNGGDVPHGMRKTEIDRLPTRKFLVPNPPSEAPAHHRVDLNKECQVCLCDYINGDLLRILPCFHEFHTRCIDKWLKINHSCPVCRIVVNVDT